MSAAPTPAASKLVIDAGVAIQWYVPEPHEAEAKRLLDPAYTLHVPELFLPEFGNIVWKKVRRLKAPELTEAEGRNLLRLVLGVPLMVHPMAPLLEAAYDLAVGPGRMTVDDCCYLALAQALGCRLVTADRAFYSAMNSGTDLTCTGSPIPSDRRPGRGRSDLPHRSSPRWSWTTPATDARDAPATATRTGRGGRADRGVTPRQTTEPRNFDASASSGKARSRRGRGPGRLPRQRRRRRAFPKIPEDRGF